MESASEIDLLVWALRIAALANTAGHSDDILDIYFPTP
jgi:hypothetical protein